jgi:hypothetical protein
MSAMRIVVVAALAACGSVGSTPDAAVGPSMDASMDAPSCVPPSPLMLAGQWRGEMTTDDATGQSSERTVGANINYVPGKHGFAFQFDGTNALVIDDGDRLWPTSSFTLEAWVNTRAIGYIVLKFQCGGACPSGPNSFAEWGLTIAGDGHPTFALRADALPTILLVTDALHDLRDGQWHHVVGVRDSVAKTAQLYVDGALAASAPLTDAQNGPMTNTDGEVDPIVIGAGIVGSNGALSNELVGAIDEVSYYNAALTAAQIMAIYNAPEGTCH